VEDVMNRPDETSEPQDYGTMDRRHLLRRWLPPAAAGLVVGAVGLGLHGRPGRHRPPDPAAATTLPDWRVDPARPGAIAIAGGEGPEANLRRALAAMGGIESFVQRGARVAIKPNCAWDRRAEQAANTNPEVVAELVRLCLAAGAASVVVLDNSCHDPARSFERSGIAPAARAAGAKVTHQGSAGTLTYDLGGTQLGPWEVLEPIARADRLINVPIVKHHSLARATLGMKNWFGAIVGRRNSLHQRLPQVSAELGQAIRPTLTVMDATRVLTAGGPTGGSLELVRNVDQVAVSTDPVAADAWGGSLLELGPRELPHLEIAARLGLGSVDWSSLRVEV
jgi:uncharacterized protein (DUF362 family)